MSGKSEHEPIISCNRCILPGAAAIGAELLDIEMWCWGRDIVRKPGNALLEYGFTRERPQEGIMGSSRYTLNFGEGCRIVLWGWGIVHHTGDEGIFLRRHGFDPKLTESRAVLLERWSPEYIPGLRSPVSIEECGTAISLLIKLLEWMGEYEAWIQERYGVDYRKDCIEARKKRTRFKAEQLPFLWGGLARECSCNNCYTAGRNTI